VQRLTGTRKGHYRLRIEPFDPREGFREILLHGELIAPAFGNDVGDGLTRCLAGAKGVFVGVDVNALIGIGKLGTLRIGEAGFRKNGHAGQG